MCPVEQCDGIGMVHLKGDKQFLLYLTFSGPHYYVLDLIYTSKVLENDLKWKLVYSMF